MKQFIPVLTQTPLFKGVDPADLPGLLRCLCAREKFYPKNQYIFQAGEPAREVGILCAGGVQVTKEDFTGNRAILAKLGAGDLFGETFACAGTAILPVNVVAAEDSEVLLVDYRKILTTCPAPCAFHNRLTQNMVGILASKNVLLNQKIDILSRRSTREKLIAFLSAQAQAAGSKQFTIPFNRQELADYLCVERSAMTTELGKLKKEGLVEFEKNFFSLQRDASG